MPSVSISPALVKTAPAAFVIFGWFPGEERQNLKNTLRRLWARFRVQRQIRWLFQSLNTFNWKQWRSEPDCGRWPQTEFNGGKLQTFPLNPEASCCFTGSAGIPATGRQARHGVCIQENKMTAQQQLWNQSVLVTKQWNQSRIAILRK